MLKKARNKSILVIFKLLSPIKDIYINMFYLTKIKNVSDSWNLRIILAPSSGCSILVKAVASHGNNYLNKMSVSHYSLFDTQAPICFSLSQLFSCCLYLCSHSLPSPFRDKEQFGCILSLLHSYSFLLPSITPQSQHLFLFIFPFFVPCKNSDNVFPGLHIPLLSRVYLHTTQLILWRLTYYFLYDEMSWREKGIAKLDTFYIMYGEIGYYYCHPCFRFLKIKSIVKFCIWKSILCDIYSER